MGDLVLVLGAVASCLSAPFGSYLRSLYFRVRSRGQVTVESAAGASLVTFDKSEDPERVADRVEELVNEAEESSTTGGPGDQKPARLNIGIADILYGLAMIAGIVAKEVWDYNIEHGKIGFNANRVGAAMIISPIVYAGVHSAIQALTESVTLIGLSVAFQNGFFWQSVFSGIQASHEGSTTPPQSRG